MAFAESRAIKSLAVCKSEATYGEDPALTPATQAFLTYESPDTWRPLVDFDNTQVHSGSRTNRLSTPGKQRIERRLKFYLQGGTAAGTADPQDPMVKCCGINVTNVPATSNTYKPSTIAQDTSTKLGVEHDGWVVETPGLFGNFVMRATQFTPMTVDFTGKGLWKLPTTSGLYSTWAGGVKRAKPFINVGMTATAGADSLVFAGNSFEFDRGINIEELDDFNTTTGIQKTLIEGAQPRVTITWAINKTPGGTEIDLADFLSHMIAQTTHNLVFTIAGAAGNTIAFTFPQLQIINVEPVTIRGVQHARTTYNVQHSTDQSEFQWATT